MKAVAAQFPEPSVPFVSWEINDLPDWPSLLSAICDLLATLIPCDEVVWNGVDAQHQRVSIHEGGAGRYHDPDVRRLLLELDDHPVTNHYLATGPGSAPVLLSDLIGDREFKNTRTWAELFGPRGVTRQLTIPTCFNRAGTAASAWSLNRSGGDFTSKDRALAVALRPLLATVETTAAWRPDPVDARRFGWGPWALRPERNAAALPVLQPGPRPR